MTGAYAVVGTRTIRWHYFTGQECERAGCTERHATRAELEEIFRDVLAHDYDEGVAAGKGER